MTITHPVSAGLRVHGHTPQQRKADAAITTRKHRPLQLGFALALLPKGYQHEHSTPRQRPSGLSGGVTFMSTLNGVACCSPSRLSRYLAAPGTIERLCRITIACTHPLRTRSGLQATHPRAAPLTWPTRTLWLGRAPEGLWRALVIRTYLCCRLPALSYSMHGVVD